MEEKNAKVESVNQSDDPDIKKANNDSNEQELDGNGLDGHVDSLEDNIFDEEEHLEFSLLIKDLF